MRRIFPSYLDSFISMNENEGVSALTAARVIDCTDAQVYAFNIRRKAHEENHPVSVLSSPSFTPLSSPGRSRSVSQRWRISRLRSSQFFYAFRLFFQQAFHRYH